MNWSLILNFYSTEVAIFNPNDLNRKEIKNSIRDSKFHIYLVCKRKKIYFQESLIDGEFGLTTLYYLDDNHKKIPLHYRHSNDVWIVNGCEQGRIL
jgi:hypothetical protein